MALIPLLNDIRHCQICAKALPNPPKPVVRAHPNAKLLIIGQAPGTKVQASGIPWDDASGKRLRQWLELSSDSFYNEEKVAIVPMGFCYPGKGKSGDLPPRKECAPEWHAALLSELPQIELILLIGKYAQDYYLGKTEFGEQFPSLTEKVANWQPCPAPFFPLPHPSPRNQFWLKRNPWYEQNTLRDLQRRIKRLFCDN